MAGLRRMCPFLNISKCYEEWNLINSKTSTKFYESYLRSISSGTINLTNGSTEPSIPDYYINPNEPISLKRARLVYQSRKRGMLENGLILSTFASKHLNKFNNEQLNIYDRLINLPSNDWDVYYWMTGVKPTPPEFDSDVLNMLKEHCQNKDKESRFRQPDLN